MNSLLTYGAAAALAVAAVHAEAQVTKTVPGEMKTTTLTVEAIEQSTRTVTVKKPDGTHDMIYVPTEIKQFDTLKVGDTINARYYENVILQLKAPGEKDTDKNDRQITRTEGTTGGTASHQRTITATITAIDPATPSITFSGPNNWTYSTRVNDKAALAKVKVGDKVDITWTEALLVSIEGGK
jgi:Cu/Ag efflux protein CusF